MHPKKLGVRTSGVKCIPDVTRPFHSKPPSQVSISVMGILQQLLRSASIQLTQIVISTRPAPI